jgi:hypothetical protein
VRAACFVAKRGVSNHDSRICGSLEWVMSNRAAELRDVRKVKGGVVIKAL